MKTKSKIQIFEYLVYLLFFGFAFIIFANIPSIKEEEISIFMVIGGICCVAFAGGMSAYTVLIFTKDLFAFYLCKKTLVKQYPKLEKQIDSLNKKNFIYINDEERHSKHTGLNRMGIHFRYGGVYTVHNGIDKDLHPEVLVYLNNDKQEHPGYIIYIAVPCKHHTVEGSISRFYGKDMILSLIFNE